MSGKPEQYDSLEGGEGRRKVQGREMVVCLREVSAAEPDRFQALLLQDFDGVAVNGQPRPLPGGGRPSGMLQRIPVAI